MRQGCRYGQLLPRSRRQPRLNYDKYFKEGDGQRNTLTEFNSNNTRILGVEETKKKIASLQYIKDELAKNGAAK